MKYLPLSQGYFALVDDEDFDRLRRFKWHVHHNRKAHYASRYYHPLGLPRSNRKLEYEVLNLPQPLPKGLVVDHINRNSLDCRKDNLRLCTVAQNNRNQGPSRTKRTSRYKGIYLVRAKKLWRSEVQHDNKKYPLGYFRYELAAVNAYNCAALQHHRRFAYLNHWRGPTPPPNSDLAQSWPPNSDGLHHLRNYLKAHNLPLKTPSPSPNHPSLNQTPALQLKFEF